MSKLAVPSSLTPVKAKCVIFLRMSSGVSVNRIEDLGSLLDILAFKPYKAGKKME